MKKLGMMLLLVGVIVAFGASQALAALVPIANSGSVDFGVTDGSLTGLPAGSTLLTSLSIPFEEISGSGKNAIKGVFDQEVWRDSSGYLFFVYQISNTGPSVTTVPSYNDITRLTAQDFGGFLTSVGYHAAAGEVKPTDADRNSVGSVIGFDFTIPITTSTASLVIATNAKWYTQGDISIIDGATADLTAWGPAVPEPASMVLFGIGLLGCGGRVIRKKFMA